MRVIAGAARGMPLKGPPGPGTRATSDKVRGVIFNVLAPVIVEARVLDLYAGTGALGVEALSRGAASCLFVEQARAACQVVEANLRATRLGGGRVWCLGVAAALEKLERALTPNPRGLDSRLCGDPEGTPSTADSPARGRGEGPIAARGVRAGAPQRNARHEADHNPRLPVSPAGDSTFMPPYDVIMLDPPYNDPEIANLIRRIGRSGLVARGGFVVLEHDKRTIPPHEPPGLQPLRSRLYGDTAVTIWRRPELDGEMLLAAESDPGRAGRASARPAGAELKDVEA